MKRIATVGVALAVVLGASAYFLSDNPKIRALFESGPPRENPLGYLDRLPEPKVPPPPVERKAPRKPAEPVADPEPPDEPEAIQNMVPNRDVGRILMQILAAKKLADGIALSVTDEAVVIYGEVSSAAKRDEIVAVVEKGRERRKLDSSHVTVAPGE